MLLSRCPLALMCVLFRGIDSFIYGYEFHNASLISVWFRFIIFPSLCRFSPVHTNTIAIEMASKQWYLDGSQYSRLFAWFRTFGLLCIAQNTRTQPVLRLYVVAIKTQTPRHFSFFSLSSLYLPFSRLYSTRFTLTWYAIEWCTIRSWTVYIVCRPVLFASFQIFWCANAFKARISNTHIYEVIERRLMWYLSSSQLISSKKHDVVASSFLSLISDDCS